MNKKLRLSKRYQTKRREAVFCWMKSNSKWKNVIFFDGKKFNLYRPDGLISYWHDLRKDKDSSGAGVLEVASLTFCEREED